jgi:hypothetical protein
LEERTLLTAPPVPLISPAGAGFGGDSGLLAQDQAPGKKPPVRGPQDDERFTFSGLAAAVTAGQSFQITLQVKDAKGNVQTGFTGAVHIASATDPRATLPPDLVFTAADHGTKTFTVTPRAAGTFTVTATDTSNNSVQAKTTAVVNAAPADHFDVGSLPPAAGSGVGFTVTVTARDPFGNVDTRYTDTVRVSSSDA